MHIWICDQANANFPVKISGINFVALYDTGTNLSCISYACYMNLKGPPSLKMLSGMLVHSAVGHGICFIGLTCCKVTIGKSQFRHTFIVCMKLQKELVFWSWYAAITSFRLWLDQWQKYY